MEIKTAKSINLKDGQFVKLTKPMTFQCYRGINLGDYNLRPGHLIKIVFLEEHQMVFEEKKYYKFIRIKFWTEDNKTIYDTIDDTPGGQIEFDRFLASIKIASPCDLDEAGNIPYSEWPKEDLIAYIHFLRMTINVLCNDD